MQEIRITISDLPEEDKIALSKLVADNCKIEDTKVSKPFPLLGK